MRWESTLWTAALAVVVTATVGAGGCGEERKVKLEVPPPPAPSLRESATAPVPKVGVSGRHRKMEGDDWVPTEFKQGVSRWRDTGIYVDGKPYGFLAFGELPIALKPVWIEERVSAPKKYGSKDPGYKIVKQRRYRFTDLFRALGIDLRKIKEVHVYGPKFSETIVVSGAELRKRGNEFMFRFGGEVWGKGIPVVPEDFGNGRSPDKISAVMVYIDKKPPKLVWNKGLELDGEIVTDVPYFGEPLRGGVRVYADDRFATVIKRRLLENAKPDATGPDGTPRWKLLGFLEAQGVNTKKLVEAWIIHGELRRRKLDRAQLEAAYFEASPQSHGEILIGAEKIPANVLAFHSRPIRPDEIPVVLDDEDPGATNLARAALRGEEF